MGAKAHAIGVLPPGDMPVAHAVTFHFSVNSCLALRKCATRTTQACWSSPERKTGRPGQSKTPSSTASFCAISKRPRLSGQGQRKTPFCRDGRGSGTGSRFGVVTPLGAPRNTFLTLATAASQFIQCCASRGRRDGRGHFSAATNRRLPSDAPVPLALAGISIDEVAHSLQAHPLSPWVDVACSDRSPEATAPIAMSDRHAVAVLAETKRRKHSRPRGFVCYRFRQRCSNG